MSNKKAKGFVLFLAAMGLLESATFAETWTLTGNVSENTTWTPIPNAKVSFVYDGGGEVSTTTDAKGKYIIKPELNKTGNLIVKADNYCEFKDNFNARTNENDFKYFDVKLQYNYYTYNGRIFDYVTSEPIKDAEITFVYEYGEGQTETVKSDEEGRYSLNVSFGKNGTLQVVKDGYVDIKEKYSERNSYCLLNNYNYEMRPVEETWTLKGKVLENKNWFPIAGAEVGFTYNDGGKVASVTTDALGNFQIKPLINKPGNLFVTAKDFRSYIESFSARSSGRDAYFCNIKLAHNYWTVSGTVIDYKTNNPVAGVNVSISYDKSTDKPLEFKTDAKGYYEYKVDIDKRGTIEFSGDGLVTKKDDFSPRGCDDYANWNYEIHKTDETFTVKGKVIDNSTRYYVEGAKVSFTYDDGGEVATETDKLGNYTLFPLINKPGKIIVSKDSYITYKTGSTRRNDTKDQAIENCTLYHNYWTLTGKIIDYKTSEGVKDATLTFYYDDGSQIDCTTDENGFYKITPENDRKGKIAITCEGYQPRREGETSKCADAFEVWNYEIKKEKETYAIVGKIYNNKDKTPIAGAAIEYTAKDGTKVSATTDEKGNYSLEAPVNQEGTLTINSKGFKEYKDSFSSYSDSRTIQLRDYYMNN